MKLPKRYSILLLTILLLAGGVEAQRISFGLYATEDIVLTPINLGEMNFNEKKTIILAGETVTINLVDNAVAILAIVGRTDLDITVTIEAPTTLDLDVTNKIPLALKFAYSNTGASTDANAKATAIEVPVGFTSATFPIIRRGSGPPAPPPTPNHTGYTAPTGTAYLFIYGTLGQVPTNAAAGLYSGNVNIHVEYSK
jgi:hypothetical protein